MGTVGTPALWIGFNVLVLGMLALDLLVFNREAHEIRIREAAIWSAIWVALSLAGNVAIYFYFGKQVALEFLAGYLLEKSLSVDNLFVFLLVLSHFAVPAADQHRVLFWGVLGALVMRIAFILIGTTLLNRFEWMIYLFGAFLVFTGLKMFFSKQEEANIEDSRVLKLVRRLIPMTEGYEGHAFFVRRNGKLLATPMLAVLVVIEASDVVFAVDSIPAVFGVTRDPFVVYTSNICAILGLRAMYFLLAGVLSMFRYLHYGLAVVLSFVGVKMLIVKFVHVPVALSLGVIAGILTITIVASVLSDKRQRRSEQQPKPEG